MEELFREALIGDLELCGVMFDVVIVEGAKWSYILKIQKDQSPSWNHCYFKLCYLQIATASEISRNHLTFVHNSFSLWYVRHLEHEVIYSV